MSKPPTYWFNACTGNLQQGPPYEGCFPLVDREKYDVAIQDRDKEAASVDYLRKLVDERVAEVDALNQEVDALRDAGKYLHDHALIMAEGFKQERDAVIADYHRVRERKKELAAQLAEARENNLYMSTLNHDAATRIERLERALAYACERIGDAKTIIKIGKLESGE